VAVALGVDVATRLGRVGVATGRWDGERVRITSVAAGGRGDLPGPRTGPTADMVERVTAWLAARVPADEPVVVGLDAPLGWPVPLVEGLQGHRAGGRLPAPDAPDRLWRRAADVHVHEQVGKLPLEVGADRIARAAWAGLEILHALRAATGRALLVPLDPTGVDDAAFEVYPAATLARILGAVPSYKGAARAAREDLLDALAPQVRVEGPHRETALDVDHAFDAVICVLAALDARRGLAAPVPDALRPVAAREGWIHVRA
jgi:hypothetical protein